MANFSLKSASLLLLMALMITAAGPAALVESESTNIALRTVKPVTPAKADPLPELRTLQPAAAKVTPVKPVAKSPAPTLPKQPAPGSSTEFALRPLPPATAAVALPTPSPSPAAAPSTAPMMRTLPSQPSGGPVSSPLFNAPSSTSATLPSRSSVQLVTDSATQQLPAGTLLRLNFQGGLSSAVSQTGEPFTALLSEDLMGTRGELLLPKGTALRGRIAEVQSSRFFSKGGLISLAFDHVVLPSGQQLPITLQLSTDEQAGLVNQQGVLYTDPGVGAKLNGSLNDGTELFYKTTRAGIDAGKGVGHGAGMILTVPVAAVGGAIAGTGVAAGKSAYNLVAKGKDVLLEPGQQVLVRLSQPTTFPVAD